MGGFVNDGNPGVCSKKRPTIIKKLKLKVLNISGCDVTSDQLEQLYQGLIKEEVKTDSI